MTEINIILDTNFQELSETTIKNDKELFYELLDKEFNIYQLNNYSKYNIPYNQILNDLLLNDNYLDYEKDLFNISSSNITKIILKKLLIFFNPIVKDIIHINKSTIINKQALTINFPIDAKIENKHKHTINQRISSNSYFIIYGLYNKFLLQSNLPFKLDSYKYINDIIIKFLSFIKSNLHIYLSNLNYNNKGFFDINKINNEDLKQLYNLYISNYNLFINNFYLSHNKFLINNKNIENSVYIKKIIKDKKLVDNNYSKNYISYFNTFLSYKINDYFNNHSYYSFQANNLLDLYEQILIYSIDKESIKNQINLILNNQKNQKESYNNKKIINEYNLKSIQLEFLTRKKFPNLFNPNSKDVIFHKHNQFNLDNLPKKYKDIILIEYNKLQTLYKQNNNNKCKHKELLNNLILTNNQYPIVEELNKLISGDPNNYNQYYKCLLCSYNLICPHVLEYYNLLFSKKEFKSERNFSIRQHLINKYMTNAKINMIYYCKVCGEELGRSLDLEQNIEYKDKIKLNTTDYTDETLEIIRNNATHIIYSYIIFTTLNINISKKYLINYVVNSIIININMIEKSLRKSKLYNEEHIINLIDFNSIIFIYATLIFIMTKYPYISFMKSGKKYYSGGRDNIIVPKKIEIKSNKDLLNLIKTRFKEAYEIIISTNNILLFKLKYNKQFEKIKELLIKTYSIVAKNDQMTLSEKSEKISNSKLLEFSSIYNYYYLIKSIYSNYPLTILSNENPTFKFNNNLYNFNYTKLKKNEYEKILNIHNIDSNKEENLFNKFSSLIIDENLLDKIIKNNKISNYNEYKIISFNLFYYNIKHELYNLPIYEYISTDQHHINNKSKFILNNVYIDKLKNNLDNNKEYPIINKYIILSQLVKLYEIELINKNINLNLYPFSLISLNNSRYYYTKNLTLNLFFCSIDGLPHKFDIYIYIDSKKSEFVFNKKQLDNNINEISKLQFLDHKCSKCNQYQNSLITSKISNPNIIKLINDNNDKNGFFNLYINVCPISIKNKTTNQYEYQFHKFNYKEINYENIICEICKIKYIDLLNKNNEIYFKFNKEYEDYKFKKQNIINNKLIDMSHRINNLNNLNIKKIYSLESINFNILNNNSTLSIIDYINKINYDTILVNFSKEFKINIIFLQKLGLTEGYNYDEKYLDSIKDNYNLLRINKLLSYFRSILIYYNLLKYHKNLINYYDLDFLNIIKKLQESSSEISLKSKCEKYLPNIKYNLLDLMRILKLNYDNEFINKYLIKLLLQFILDLNIINKEKFDNKLDSFIKFIFSKILKFDELFTNFNYSQLKQMFNEDKFDINLSFQEKEEFNNEDDDDLFGYNDLNIQFEDEEPIDE